MPSLSAGDIQTLEEIIREVVSPKDGDALDLKRTLPLGVEVLDLLIFHIMIPIVASICACGIYDMLKSRNLRSLTRKESKEIIQSFVNKQIVADVHISSDVRKELIKLLGEYGIEASAIDNIVDHIAEHIKGKKS